MQVVLSDGPFRRMMTQLTELFCKDNWLKTLPMELRSLAQLRFVHLKGNQLQVIDQIQLPGPREWVAEGHDPAKRTEVLGLMQLIRVGHNKLRGLPERLGELECLRMVVANSEPFTL